jgi:hypothetical protein
VDGLEQLRERRVGDRAAAVVGAEHQLAELGLLVLMLSTPRCIWRGLWMPRACPERTMRSPLTATPCVITD